MWFVCMTSVPPFTNKVCLLLPTLTRWMGHVTKSNGIQGFPPTVIMLCWQTHLSLIWATAGTCSPVKAQIWAKYSVLSGRCATWTASSHVLGSSFSWLLITARCGVCCRRIMFPTLTTALSGPGDLYNCTEYEPDVWIPCLDVSMHTAQPCRQTCWFLTVWGIFHFFQIVWC